ncbi:RNAse P Rpr2/Rpp21/SNM1 subunit domain-domain-containing protein [Absidia repens]|uniref:RNAse P Rpr2/Rpp21/SNM1 subunit domain-domain-containing protein n=1 Tax=Absidia repens TaxID=90262 RepID=A0A1X2IQ36_9FUNG|nr:RNAse P Rpr2/Rpp21/SNM1 subunit domain-domain-containing protein [Absidia repens]
MAKQKSKLPGASQQHIRMNFLSQAASLMAMLSSPIPAQQRQLQQEPRPDRPRRSSYRRNLVFQDDHNGLHSLSRYYNTTLKKIGQRMVLRLDPHLKRTICRRCNTSLIPAMTSTIRIRSRPETVTVTTCNICGEEKRLVAQPQYQLFNDRSDVHFNRSASDDDGDDEAQIVDKKTTELVKRTVDVDKNDDKTIAIATTTTINPDEISAGSMMD